MEQDRPGRIRPDRLLVDSIDVGHALVNLSRDLHIDVSALAASDPWLEGAFFDALEDAGDPTMWICPDPSGIAHPKGFYPATDGTGNGVSRGDGGGDEDLPCPVGLSPRCIYDEAGSEQCSCILVPVLCRGLCCILNCDDGEACTDDFCAYGACYYIPNTDPCDAEDWDNDPCTKDVCANKVCTYPDRDCLEEIEWDACTKDIRCLEGLGCFHDWLCEDGDPCNDDWCEEQEDGSGWCFHASIWPYYEGDNLCSNTGCTGSISFFGSYIAVNNDDDNGNRIPDILDTGPVTREDDLKPVNISFSQNCITEVCEDGGDEWNLTALYKDDVGFTYNDDKSSIMKKGQPFPAPSQVYMEGRSTSSVCGAPLLGSVALGAPVNTVCCLAESAPLHVVEVVKLEWEPYQDPLVQNPALGTCPINGGRRIFTGKIDPSDTEATKRRYVHLVATIEPPISGVTVHFRVWDVDDPFDQLYGPNRAAGVDEILNVTAIDGNTYGPDNRGGVGGLIGSATTDSDGRAVKRVTTSRQPGDNYRAAATCLGHVLTDGASWPAQVNQNHADALSVKTDEAEKFVPNGGDSGYKVPVVWSKMLTVWRKLHVETDTMVRPTFVQNTYTMNWRNPVQDASPDRVVIEVEDTLGGFATPTGQFDEGWVRISGPPGTAYGRVFEYQSSAGWDEVVLIVSATNGIGGQKGLSGLGGLTSGVAILSDDDLGEETTFKAAIWGCDAGYAVSGSLQPPDLSALAVRYEPGYILPIQDDTVSGIGGIATFLQNVKFGFTGNYGKALWDQVKSPTVRQLPIATSEYWTVMVVSAWQAETGKDADPNTELLTNGVNTHNNGATSSSLGASYTGLCAIFKALMIGESDIPERYTVAHEIAHTLGVPHTTSGLMFPAEPAEGAAQQSQPFSADSLLELREYSGP